MRLLPIILALAAAAGPIAPPPAAAEPSWIRLEPVLSPSARAEYGFAFDDTREAAVLFGGSANLTFAAVNAETWEWDGATWTLAPQGGPSARCDQTMAFDTLRERIAIFGGFNGTYLADTWERSGTIWSLAAIPGPGARADAFMAFDRNRGVMVLFGGQAPGPVIRGDTESCKRRGVDPLHAPQRWPGGAGDLWRARRSRAAPRHPGSRWASRAAHGLLERRQ
jgi:hypothetical protein